LRLREPADAAARSRELVGIVRSVLPEAVRIHDLGCGSGSMARWLSAQLPGPQHWVLVDRDEELLDLAAASPPDHAANGAAVTIETSRGDVTRMGFGGADLITASALIDMLTVAELERLVVNIADAECPALTTLSVIGDVELTPSHPFDSRIREAFNAHQRRDAGDGRLLGPDAVGHAEEAFIRLGLEVLVRPSPWRLGPGPLAEQWFAGWVGAACEQEPGLRAEALAHSRLREAEPFAVTLQHLDLLALPRD